ncbi:hypothetical protein CC86DRAFT_62153 [Ophiobolus disseminans]|uniref:Uncharacterized protein n=1 Tax=Ophiobolus disseminans TaxID=1469910 RepID=A0A6A6ZU19_9PLEO|nr:hypothetical protein CC86DRAFT_62153 [Ophiobolus disseminans]
MKCYKWLCRTNSRSLSLAPLHLLSNSPPSAPRNRENASDSVGVTLGNTNVNMTKTQATRLVRFRQVTRLSTTSCPTLLLSPTELVRYSGRICTGYSDGYRLPSFKLLGPRSCCTKGDMAYISSSHALLLLRARNMIVTMDTSASGDTCPM